MSDYRVLCLICKKPDRLIDLIDDPPLTYWRLYESWGRTAGRRTSGSHGGNDMRGRKPKDLWAHNACVDAEVNGIGPEQGSLL
jgi:hypothetical protein